MLKSNESNIILSDRSKVSGWSVFVRLESLVFVQPKVVARKIIISRNLILKTIATNASAWAVAAVSYVIIRVVNAI